MDNLSVRQLNYLTEKYQTDSSLQSDKEITLAVVRRNASMVQYADKKLQQDVDVAIACVKADGRALRFLSEEIRSNEEVVLCAVENFCASYSFATGKALKSKAIAKVVAKRGGETIALLQPEFLDDEEIARLAIERNAKALGYFSSRIRSIESIVMQALTRDRTAICYVADDAFKSKKVFEKALGISDGRVRITSLTNATPYGVFDEIDRRGVTFSISAQSIDFLSLDREKLIVCLKRGEGAIVKKADLLRKYVSLEDCEIVSLIIERCNLSHKVILTEVKFASENRKIRVLQILLRATQGLGEKEVDDKSQRMYFLRSLRRKSPTAVARFKENFSKYLSDKEIVMAVAEADGTILKTLAKTDYINDDSFVTVCLKSYVVKSSDGALLNGLNLNLNYEQAMIACARDGRNYFYLSQEYQKVKAFAVVAVRSTEEVYDKLSQEFKEDEDVLREKRLWIR